MIYIGLAIATVALVLLGWAFFRLARGKARNRTPSPTSEQGESTAQVPTPYPDSEILESTEQLYIVNSDTRVSFQTDNTGDVFYLPRGTLILRVHHRYIYIDSSQNRSQEVPRAVMALGLQRRTILAVPTEELLGYLTSPPPVPTDISFPSNDDDPEIFELLQDMARNFSTIRTQTRRPQRPRAPEQSAAESKVQPEGPSQIDRLLKEDDLV